MSRGVLLTSTSFNAFECLLQQAVEVIFHFIYKLIHSKNCLVMSCCCKSKELERNKEETKREFKGNSDDLYFMLIKPIYRLIVRRPKAFT